MLRSKFSFLLSLALPLAVLAVPVLGSSTALAEETPAAPTPRTTVSASFQRYVLSPGGRPMGMLLSDGTFVGTPGHSMAKDAPALAPGAKIDVEGEAMLTPTGTVIHRAVVKQNGTVVADATSAHGRRHHHHQDGQAREGQARKHEGRHHAVLTPMTAEGKVASIVSSPRGRVLAVVLADGTTAMGHGLKDLGLKVGDKVALTGEGGVYAQGKALRIEKITLPSGVVKELPKRTPRAVDPSQTPA
jgi:hypothetical protein